MDNIDWLKQTNEPAFPELLWSRPQNRATAGKLLIVGGSLHSISALSKAYSAALKAGVGTARVLAPDALAKTLAQVFPEAQFAPSTAGGNFARSSLAEVFDNATWADGLLLAGDFGNNSETATMLEGLVAKYSGTIVVTGDTADTLNLHNLLERPSTTMVIDIIRLQKLAAQDGLAIKQLSDLMQLVTKLAEWNKAAAILTAFQDFIIVSANKRVSTTAGGVDLVELAAFAAVWQIQQPPKPFEALTSAAYVCLHKSL